MVEAWLARVETPPEDAKRVRELLADNIENDALRLQSIVVRASKER